VNSNNSSSLGNDGFELHLLAPGMMPTQTAGLRFGNSLKIQVTHGLCMASGRWDTQHISVFHGEWIL
jgi:hypothetical protein